MGTDDWPDTGAFSVRQKWQHTQQLSDYNSQSSRCTVQVCVPRHKWKCINQCLLLLIDSENTNLVGTNDTLSSQVEVIEDSGFCHSILYLFHQLSKMLPPIYLLISPWHAVMVAAVRVLSCTDMTRLISVSCSMWSRSSDTYLLSVPTVRTPHSCCCSWNSWQR